MKDMRPLDAANVCSERQHMQICITWGGGRERRRIDTPPMQHIKNQARRNGGMVRSYFLSSPTLHRSICVPDGYV